MKVIERYYGYHRGKPAMIFRPAGRDNKARPYLLIDDLLKCSDTHNETFMKDMADRAKAYCTAFEIDIPVRQQQFNQLMFSIADTIMGGIDDLVDMPNFRAGIDDPDLEIDKKWLAAQKIKPDDIQVGIMQ
jgi:hypothetical protein